MSRAKKLQELKLTIRLNDDGTMGLNWRKTIDTPESQQIRAYINAALNVIGPLGGPEAAWDTFRKFVVGVRDELRTLSKVDQPPQKQDSPPDEPPKSIDLLD